MRVSYPSNRPVQGRGPWRKMMGVLPNLPDERWRELAGELKGRGFACDAEGHWLTERDVKYNLTAIEEKLREFGDSGGLPCVHSFERPDVMDRAEDERMYILCNSNRFDSLAAAEHAVRGCNVQFKDIRPLYRGRNAIAHGGSWQKEKLVLEHVGDLLEKAVAAFSRT